MPCVCQAERVSVCPGCEKELTVKLANAFKKGGYKVDVWYCKVHQPKKTDKEKGLEGTKN